MPDQTWRESATLIYRGSTLVDAVQGAHQRLDVLYQDWRQRAGATQLTIITTQMLTPQTDEGPAWVFLITYQIDGVGPGPNTPAPPPAKTPRGKAKL